MNLVVCKVCCVCSNTVCMVQHICSYLVKDPYYFLGRYPQTSLQGLQIMKVVLPFYSKLLVVTASKCIQAFIDVQIS